MNLQGPVEVGTMDDINRTDAAACNVTPPPQNCPLIEAYEFCNALSQTNCRLELLRTANMTEFMTTILRMVNRLGFSDFSFTRLKSSSDPDAHLVSTPRAISAIYKESSVWQNDLMLQHAAYSQEPRFQSVIDNYVASAPVCTDAIMSNRESRRVRVEHGYQEYYGIPICAANGNGNILMAVTAKDMPVPEFHARIEKVKDSLTNLAYAIDYVGTKRFSAFFLGEHEDDTIIIHPKPLRLLLTIAAENLSLKDAASRLCISESTANQHIAAAKKALGATTTASAVYKAIRTGLIDCKK
jgi:DNA-binding CsgD family transcriptional regulator